MIDFPNAPTVGDLFTAAGITFRWDGVAWGPVPMGVNEAPNDGKTYGRKSLGWSVVDLASLGIPLHDTIKVTTGASSEMRFAPGVAGNVGLVLDTFSASGTANQPFIGARKAGVQRWQINMAEGAETGSANGGGDFYIYRYSDAGAVLGMAFAINRATGAINTAASITCGGNLTAGSGMGFVWDGGNANFLRMGASSANWSWQWNRTTGDLNWLAGSANSIFSITGAGHCYAARHVAQSETGLWVNGTVSDGSTYSLQSLVVANPSWNTIDFRSRHQYGQWAGYEFVTGGGQQIRLTMSNGGSWGSIQALAFEVQSDARSKRDAAPVASALDVIDGIKAATYAFIPLPRAEGDETPIYPGKPRYCGSMAQDWQARLPEAVSDLGDGNLALDYAAIAAVTAQAVSELLARVRSLEAELQTLKGATP